MHNSKLSVFPNVQVNSNESMTFKEVINCIKSNEYSLKIKQIREYIASGKIVEANKLKHSLPAFTPSGLFNSNHKSSSLLKYSKILHLDFDKLTNDQLVYLRGQVKDDKYVLGFFDSPSSNGLKVFFLTKGEHENHAKNIQKLIAIYYRKFKILADESCKDLGRLCFFSHDSNAYYNDNAEAIDLASEFHELDELVIKTIKNKNLLFVNGERNNFIFQSAIKCHMALINKDIVINYFNSYYKETDFGLNEIENTVDSAYKYQVNSKKELLTNHSKYERISDLLLALGYRFKRNIVTQTIDCWIKEKWVELTEPIQNDLIREVNKMGIPAKETEIKIILNSDQIEQFDPFQDYINGLEAWDGFDYIGQLWATLNLDEDYQYYFDKWLLLLVASIVDPSINNQYVCTLVGPQGIGKTSWLSKLIPTQLKAYMYQGILDLKDKDTKITISENLIINLDEMNAIDRRETARLKELISSSGYKVRAPYAKMQIYRKRRASFCASLNDKQFLIDKTGSRRFLIIELHDKINHLHNINIDMVYAQAYAKYTLRESLFFTNEQEREIRERNENFNVISIEEELLNDFFRLPNDNEDFEWMSATEIATYLSANNLIFKPNNETLRVIGQIMSRIGYTKKKSMGTSSYKVKKIKGE
jgi:predicted P-loop ATPase